jgi:hypothetical protein
MGCGASKAPDVILPDPVGACTVYCEKQGTFARDYEFFQNDKDGPKWLFLDKQGSPFSDDAKFVLENYVRNNPEKKNEGECLATCKFDTIDAGCYKQYGFEGDGIVDSDDSDGYSDDSDDEEQEQKGKWSFKCKCKFWTDREKTNLAAVLRVKAKGKAKRKVTFGVATDAEGNETETHSVHEKKKIKKFIYKLTVGADEDTGEKVPINLEGSVNKKETKLDWVSPMFEASLKGGFFSPKPTISVKEGNWTAGIAMLIGFITCMEFSPDDVVSGLGMRWPTVTGPMGSQV